MTAAAVSKHLGILKDAGLVSIRRDAQRKIYELESSPLEIVMMWLKEFPQDDRYARLKHEVARKTKKRARLSKKSNFPKD